MRELRNGRKVELQGKRDLVVLRSDEREVNQLEQLFLLNLKLL